MAISRRLKRMLAAEQISFMRRSRKHWGSHLARARDFIGAALKGADPSRPVLILGAGCGLEIPWNLAPADTFGWDAAPLSRLWTCLRHHRWPPWVFDDMTGAFGELDKVSRRSTVIPGRWTLRPAHSAARRLAGLLPSVPVVPCALREWIVEHRPGAIVCANVLGQLKPIAMRIIERAFRPMSPWVSDPDLKDPLQEALDIWIARLLRAIVDVLRDSNSALCLLHDRAVIHQDADIALGGWEDSWAEQLKTSERILEASDPLSGVDFLNELNGLSCRAKERWIWPLAPKQIHIVEALAYGK